MATTAGPARRVRRVNEIHGYLHERPSGLEKRRRAEEEPANLGLRFTTSPPPALALAAVVIKGVKSQASSLKLIHRRQLVKKDTADIVQSLLRFVHRSVLG